MLPGHCRAALSVVYLSLPHATSLLPAPIVVSSPFFGCEIHVRVKTDCYIALAGVYFHSS
jgi:hypothetical protein